MKKTTLENLSFEIKLKTVPVKLSGADYELRELTGEGREAYQEDVRSRTEYTFDPTGKAKVTNIKSQKGLQTHLLSLSLFDSTGKPVPVEVLKNWPSATLDKLELAARELSGLDRDEEKEEAEVKKD